MEDDYLFYDQDYYDNEPNQSCEKCNRTYNDIDFDYQCCSKCGWDTENKEWTKPIKPTDDDFLCGDADILTGRWY